ncbi:MAG TPA: Hsp20/alpha crystallin family protein [Thermomicrobiales bacterium]|nr:Hsp20/alpha crystallin family protein [Thermomicrobiales bacterium]
MGSQRWDPRSDIISLREAMSNLLEESFVRPSGSRPGVGLAVDVRETPDRYEIFGSVPGMAPEDVDITILGDTVRIRGERRASAHQDEEEDGVRWLIRERHAGGFERTITLPASVRAEEASAEFRDGVLTITLPKADEAKARTIPVRSGGSVAEAKAIDVGESQTP